jgi:hypothetical protein
MTTQQQRDDRILELLHEVRTMVEHMGDVCHQVALKIQPNVPPPCPSPASQSLPITPTPLAATVTIMMTKRAAEITVDQP